MRLQDTLIRCEFEDDRNDVDVSINISSQPPAYAMLPKGMEQKNDMILLDLSKLHKETLQELQALVAREYCRQFNGLADVYHHGRVLKNMLQPSTT